MDKQRRYRVLHYDMIVLLTIVLVFVGIHVVNFFKLYPESYQARSTRVLDNVKFMKDEIFLRTNNTLYDLLSYSIRYSDYLYSPDSVYSFCKIVANSLDQIVAVAVVPSEEMYPGRQYFMPVYIPYYSNECFNASVGHPKIEKLLEPYHLSTVDFLTDGSINLLAEPTTIEIKGTTQHAVLFGFPVLGKGEKIDAMIVCALSLDAMSSFVESTNQYKSGEFYIISRQGNFAVHPDLLKIGSPVDNWFYEKYGPKADSIISRTMHDNKDYSCQSDNGKLMWSIGTIEGSWFMFYAVDYNEVFRSLQSDILFVIFVAILGTIIILYVCAMNIKKATDRRAKQTSIEKDLEFAAKLQSSLLVDSVISSKNIDLSASLLPARTIGGDVYFYKEYGDKLIFSVGDVSGKGVTASLMMSRVVGLLRVFTSQKTSASEICSLLNEEICFNNKQFHFVTFFLGILDTKTGILTYCNAGHDEPVYMTPNNPPVYLHTSENLPLGTLSGAKYTEKQMQLSSGSYFTLYTDGVTEAMNSSKKAYGTKRLLDTISACHAESSAAMNSHILEDVRKFAGNSIQSDDITILTVNYKCYEN